MKILGIFWFYKPANIYGGPVASVSSLLEGLVLKGFDVTVLTTNVNGKERLDVPINKQMIINGVKIYYLPVSFNFLSINFSLELTRSFITNIKNFDLVISGLLWHPIIVSVIKQQCLRNKTPYVIMLFGQLMPWALNLKKDKKKIFLSLFGKKYLNNAIAFHCTSEEELKAVNEIGLKTPAFLLPHRVDKSRFSNLPSKGELKKKLGIPNNHKVLLFLGRLHKVKRPDIALESLINLGRGDVHLIFAGHDEGGYKDKFTPRLKETNYYEKVHFLGLLDQGEINLVLVDSDLLIMPSEQENFGNSAAEALMVGLPTLTSKFVPVGLQAQEAGCGHVTDLTVHSFANEIRTLIETPGLLGQMSIIGRKFAENNYENQALVQQASFYENLITKKNNKAIF